MLLTENEKAEPDGTEQQPPQQYANVILHVSVLALSMWRVRMARPARRASLYAPAHRTCQHSVVALRRKASYLSLPGSHARRRTADPHYRPATAPEHLSSRIGCQHCFQEGQHRRLFRFEGVIPTCRFGAGRTYELLLQGTAEITIDHRRMNIALPADRPGIAEQLRHGGHGIDHIARGLGVAGELRAG